MEHPKRIGDRTTLTVMTALERAGYELYMPFGENTRTDLIIDDGEHLLRVQCKTGRLRKGALRFATCGCYAHHRSSKAPRRDYLGQIDAFAVFCPETDGVYLVPIQHARLRVKAALRVYEPRNGQRQRIRFAADYLICTINATRPTAGIS